MCNSSNWGQKSKTRVSYWWSCISLFAHVLGVKCVRCPIIHFSTWKLKQNKCTHKCSKRGNTPRKWWFKSNQFKRIHVLTSFCLASDPRQEKRQSHMPVDLKKAEFAPAGVQARSPSCTFHPEVTGAGGKFQSKTILAKTQTLTLTICIDPFFFFFSSPIYTEFNIWSVFFIQFVTTSLYNVSKLKIYPVFKTKARICSHENVKNFLWKQVCNRRNKL